MLNYGVRQGSRGRKIFWTKNPAGGVQPDKEKRPPQVRQAFLTW